MKPRKMNNIPYLKCNTGIVYHSTTFLLMERITINVWNSHPLAEKYERKKMSQAPWNGFNEEKKIHVH